MRAIVTEGAGLRLRNDLQSRAPCGPTGRIIGE
jgi:hypothetical protein